MLRSTVNQAVLDLFADPDYLEIGVDQGATFHEVKAPRKIAVDINFAFDVAACQADPANKGCRYVNMSSDAFFHSALVAGETFDVIFVDGLHTFEQTLRDLLNGIACLKDGGVIIVDDVIPSAYSASIPDLTKARAFWAASGTADGSWMGDVYRLAFFVQDYMPSFSYATVSENHGQMILWKSPRRLPSARRSVEAIARTSYMDSVMYRDAFRLKPLAEIVAALQAWKQRPRAGAVPVDAAAS